MGYWDELYRTGHTLQPSPFAVDVARALPARAGVLDLGCGNGRDTNHFAALGHLAIGIDVSRAAVESARAARDATGVAARCCAFRRGDVTDSGTIADALGRLPRDLPRVVYARFLLHSVPPDRAWSLIGALGQRLGRAEAAYLEFRTDEDAELPKLLEHPRHFVSLGQFREMTAEARLDATVLAHGRGLAVFGSEDPVVARVRVTARRPTRRQRAGAGAPGARAVSLVAS